MKEYSNIKREEMNTIDTESVGSISEFKSMLINLNISGKWIIFSRILIM